jgi:hypothetical protein
VAGTNSQINDWLRGLPLGIKAVVDVADQVMSARNSMKWRVDLGTPTSDGIHPLTVLHSQIASGASTAFKAALAVP